MLMWLKNSFKETADFFQWTQSRKNFQTSPVTSLVRTVLLVPAQQKETKTCLGCIKGISEYMSVVWNGFNIPEKYWSKVCCSQKTRTI